MSAYKNGSFDVINNTIEIDLCGAKFSVDDVSDETRVYLSKQVVKGIKSGNILEIDSPLDDEEKHEMEHRCSEIAAIMENDLFEPEDEDILTCEWQQLNRILGYEPAARKEIHIWLSDDYPRDMFVTYQDVTTALAHGVVRIDTPIPLFCSSKYTDMGYHIFAHMIDGETVAIHEGKVKNTGREIRRGMNWMHLLLCNEFGHATDDIPITNKP